MESVVSTLHTNLFPYLSLSLKLADKPRRGGGNVFRHQMETLAILLEYGYTEPVLLKSSLIHDLLEDGTHVDCHTFEDIATNDEDYAAVLALVQEVSRQVVANEEEPKSEFLLRIMLQGSEKAKILKLADRISNISALPLAGDQKFIKNYTDETVKYILPYANNLNPAMAKELKNRIALVLKSIDHEHT